MRRSATHSATLSEIESTPASSVRRIGQPSETSCLCRSDIAGAPRIRIHCAGSARQHRAQTFGSHRSSGHTQSNRRPREHRRCRPAGSSGCSWFGTGQSPGSAPRGCRSNSPCRSRTHASTCEAAARGLSAWLGGRSLGSVVGDDAELTDQVPRPRWASASVVGAANGAAARPTTPPRALRCTAGQHGSDSN